MAAAAIQSSRLFHFNIIAMGIKNDIIIFVFLFSGAGKKAHTGKIKSQ